MVWHPHINIFGATPAIVVQTYCRHANCWLLGSLVLRA